MNFFRSLLFSGHQHEMMTDEQNRFKKRQRVFFVCSLDTVLHAPGRPQIDERAGDDAPTWHIRRVNPAFVACEPDDVIRNASSDLFHDCDPQLPTSLS